jgi:hypothetical protein
MEDKPTDELALAGIRELRRNACGKCCEGMVTVFSDTVFSDTVFSDTVLADTVLADTVKEQHAGVDGRGRKAEDELVRKSGAANRGEARKRAVRLAQLERF